MLIGKGFSTEDLRSQFGEQRESIESLTEQAYVCFEKKQYQEAETHLRQLLESHIQFLGTENPLSLFMRQLLGRTLVHLIKLYEAEVHLRQVMDSRNRLLGKHHYQTLMIKKDLSYLLLGGERLFSG